jgi:hypothetical protein
MFRLDPNYYVVHNTYLTASFVQAHKIMISYFFYFIFCRISMWISLSKISASNIRSCWLCVDCIWNCNAIPSYILKIKHMLLIYYAYLRILTHTYALKIKSLSLFMRSTDIGIHGIKLRDNQVKRVWI